MPTDSYWTPRTSLSGRIVHPRGTSGRQAAANKPCRIEFRAILHEPGPWKVWTERGVPARMRSVRQARAHLVTAAYAMTDRLSRASYEARLVFDDGTIRPIRESALDHAVAVAAAEQDCWSIGRRLERGEAVAV